MFEKCKVPLLWWPWWPINAADVYMGSLLSLARMQREGDTHYQVTLDTLRPPNSARTALSMPAAGANVPARWRSSGGPLNAADVYMGSLLLLDRMIREGLK